MPLHGRRDMATSNVLAWSSHAANVEPASEEDASADVDEPPDQTDEAQQAIPTSCHSFQKTSIQRPREPVESLLTRALQSQSEDEHMGSFGSGSATGNSFSRRRRSNTSNTSAASTADFTSDTGITTPPRAMSPSPRLVHVGPTPAKISFGDAKAGIRIISPNVASKKPASQATDNTTTAKPPARKPCISFACGPPKPVSQAPSGNQAGKVSASSGAGNAEKPAVSTTANDQPRRSCIKFVCPTRPSEAQKPHLSSLKMDGKMMRKPSPAPEPRSPTLRRFRQPSVCRSPRLSGRASRQSSQSPLTVRSKKYITAGPADLERESTRFHEFASDALVEDEWIVQAKPSASQKITINDTLKKELAIRLLAKEAEEEADQEENEDEDDDEGENDDEDDAEMEDEDEDGVDGERDAMDSDGSNGFSSDEEGSDGYNTDNEVGFASSDDEDDGLVLWAVNPSAYGRHFVENFDNDHTTLMQNGTPIFRRLSMDDHSDSSGYLVGTVPARQDRPKNRELARPPRAPTPELPDSTDFVCGTFDEDRPLEEAYLSHKEANRRAKLLAIPQDIDPSFPTSDIEDESDNDSRTYSNRAHRRNQQQQQQPHGSADDQVWLHGELEDIHHDEQDRPEARWKSNKPDSPRRYRSPPPPKARGRSPAPRRVFDRRSPNRKLKSPAPAPMAVPVPADQTPVARALAFSPHALPVEMGGAEAVAFQTLAFRPGLTHAKSLPRASVVFRPNNPQPTQPAHAKGSRRPKANGTASTIKPMHIRGAQDIVKGLEQKRQRRKEKYQQKHCNRARKGQVPERRPQRGEGAERMRELGLLMAGKLAGQEHYVLSI